VDAVFVNPGQMRRRKSRNSVCSTPMRLRSTGPRYLERDGPCCSVKGGSEAWSCYIRSQFAAVRSWFAAVSRAHVVVERVYDDF
jgi:hypothetical protein